MTSPPETAAPRARIAAIDAARGAALIGMFAYHLSWDLANFGWIDAGIPSNPPMRIFSHLVAASFLALAGASLALAHGDGVRWAAFLKRIALVAAAALLVTAASYFFAPDQIIGFGILHCIALACVLCAPLLGGPPALAFVIAALGFATPLLIATPTFDAPAIAWLGLGASEPLTLDWRPLLPWGGFVFLGLGLMQLWRRGLSSSAIAVWRPGASGRALSWAGRHSLTIYLLHQPLLFALFTVLPHGGVSAYAQACESQCAESGVEPQRCALACQCVAREAGKTGLKLDRIPDAESSALRQRLANIVQACIKTQ